MMGKNIIELIKRKTRWKVLKGYLLVIFVITFIISIFDYTPNYANWFIEILKNLVLSICIAFAFLLFETIYDLLTFNSRWVRYVAMILTWTLAGLTGAGLGWLVDDLLFGVRITHPILFFTLASSISIAVAAGLTGYSILQDQVKMQAQKLHEKELNEQKLLINKTKAELEALRSKVNPHFFFNTLNSIASLIPKDPAKAEELVVKFSNLFRYPFSVESFSFIELHKEIEFIEEYLEIEKIRLGDRLQYNIKMDAKLVDFKIPGMILQPIVENSIIHGISKVKAGGNINIECLFHDHVCLVKITDNGKGFDQKCTPYGFGITGVKDRLELIYGRDDLLSIKSKEKTMVQIIIPKN